MKSQGRRQKERFRTSSFISSKHSTDAHSVGESIGRDLIKGICKRGWKNYSRESIISNVKVQNPNEAQNPNVKRLWHLVICH
jgi:hypothetical protein